MERTLPQKLVAEFVGTATLVFIGAGAIVAAAQFTAGAFETEHTTVSAAATLVGIALAYGLAYAVMVSALGHVSGAHLNPAVTIGLLTTLKIEAREAAAYIGAQLAGALAAAAILRWALPEAAWRAASLGTPGVSSSISTGQAVVIEAMLTFFLVWVIFATAIDPEGTFGKIAGLAIGFTIVAGALMGGPFTGAAMNPARWFGPAVAGGGMGNWWVWLVGPIAGAIVAASIYDWMILSKRGAGGSAEPGEAPHAWGAHGDDADAVRDSRDE